MKKVICVLGCALFLMACDNNGSSTGEKLDSLGNKLESSAERVADSIEEKGERLKDKIEERLDKDDTTRKNDTLKRQ